MSKISKGSTINHLWGPGAKQKKNSFGGLPKEKKFIHGASEKKLRSVNLTLKKFSL